MTIIRKSLSIAPAMKPATPPQRRVMRAILLLLCASGVVAAEVQHTGSIGPNRLPFAKWFAAVAEAAGSVARTAGGETARSTAPRANPPLEKVVRRPVIARASSVEFIGTESQPLALNRSSVLANPDRFAAGRISAVASSNRSGFASPSVMVAAASVSTIVPAVPGSASVWEHRPRRHDRNHRRRHAGFVEQRYYVRH